MLTHTHTAMHPVRFVAVRKVASFTVPASLTDPLTTLELLNPSPYVSEQHKIYRSSYREAVKL